MRQLVPKLRKLVKYLSLGTALSAAGFLYHWATKPYQVRFFVAPDANDLSSEQVSIYSAGGTSNPVFVSINCHPDKLRDLRFRPVLEMSREWSLREMIPGIVDAKAILVTESPKTIDELADRHMVGGLADWEGVEDLSLRSRVRTLLAEKGWRLNEADRTRIENEFVQLPNRHETASLDFPATMKALTLWHMRSALDGVEQGWEKDVNTVTTELVLRWQSLTGTSLLVPLAGVGGETPVFVSLPALKTKSGAVITVSEETGVGPGTRVDVSAGEEEVYRSRSYDELKMAAYQLAFLNHPRTFVVVSLFVVVFGWAAYYLWRWPGHLNDVALFNDAQTMREDELWDELRKRNPWADRYVTEHFLKRRAGVPTQDVLAAFWRLIREAFQARPVAVRNAVQAQQAIFDVLDKALFDALR